MKKPIPILYVIGSLDVGGAEKHLLQILPALNQSVFSPTIFCLTERGSLATAMEQAGVPVNATTARLTQSTILRRAKRLIETSIGLYHYIKKNKPTIIHFFLPEAYCLGGLISLIAGPRIKIMSRRSLNHYQQRHRLLKHLEYFLHKRMSTIVGNSKAVINNLQEEWIAPNNLQLIYNGVALPQQTNIIQAREAQRISPDTLVLVMTANLIPYKGHADLLHALAQCALPPRWQLILIGEDRGIKSSLEQLATHLHIAAHIQYIHHSQDPSLYLRIADIGLLASHEEGFSNALLEYMAHGLSIVATDVGGNREALENTGLIVPASNPKALAAGIEQLTNNHTRQIMSQQAKERAKHFSIAACVKAYETLYKEHTAPSI